MICPYCQTDNRDDRETCYYCNKDLSMLRLIVNKAKLHYNQGLEFAERDHLDDAIVELQNALDLDASLVNAQVVLGTLYAKKEQFDAAREAWQRALAHDHRYEKAHEYLIKSEKAEQVFPLVNRLKRLVVGLAGAAGVLLILLLIMTAVALHSDPGLKQVSAAVKLIESGDPQKASQAGKLLAGVIENHSAAISTEMAKSLATHLRQQDAALRQQQQDRLSLASSAINDNPYLALQMANLMDEKAGDEAMRQSIKRLRSRATETINQRIRQYADQYFAGTLPFELFRDEANRYLQLPASGAHDDVAKLLERAREMHRKRLETDAMAEVTKAPLNEAPALIVKWEARSTELGEPLRKLLDQRLGGETNRTVNEIDKLLAQGQTTEAHQRVEELARTWQSAQRSAPDRLLADLRARIDAAQRQQALAAIHESYQNKQWEDCIAKTANVDQLTTSPEERTALGQMRAEAQQAYATETWNWFQARDNQFTDGSISAGDADHALKVYEPVLAYLPEKQSYARGMVMLYTAAACQKLGQPDRARDLLNRILQEYPKSPVAKNATRELKKLEAAAPPADQTPKADKLADGQPAAQQASAPAEDGETAHSAIKPVKKKSQDDEE